MPTSADPKPPRRYGGATAAERREARRRKLLDTALELFGVDGPPAPIETLCATARVSTSHFYDLYKNRDELLRDLFDELSQELLQRLAAAAAQALLTHEAQVRAGVGAYVDYVAEDPRVARLLLVVPHAASDEMLAHRRTTMQATTALLEQSAAALVAAGELPDRDYHWTAVALVGAGTELLSAWFLSEPRPPVDVVREELVRAHLRLAGGGS